ncbi:DUF2262 domain-containing protein [Priestia endophytica]|uniref:DUF2262 domain-containing protein n=1 Tax=Priestia endophytica TaxID=135735 RepID=UPI0020416727|nr:DUF2262 domain-containing protein [Priestia endophytica]MCM3537751.1 DUF2262 domain-containing protein [Priestia endophytica]
MYIKLSKTSELSRFQSRFTEEVIEIAAVTGALGIGAGRAGNDELWTASIELITWKTLHNNEPVKKEEVRLQWLADDEEWQKTRNMMDSYTIVKLQVRRGENSMMLVDLLDPAYKDNELERILDEAKKPVYYHDELLGEFTLEKGVKLFKKCTSWNSEECYLCFDLDEDLHIMKSALETAHILFNKQDEWNRKIRTYAAEELVELANDWLQEDDEAEVDEITKEMFINSIKVTSISVDPDGDFTIYFSDGDMFGGHCIIVDGNVSGVFSGAEIAG